MKKRLSTLSNPKPKTEEKRGGVYVCRHVRKGDTTRKKTDRQTDRQTQGTRDTTHGRDNLKLYNDVGKAITDKKTIGRKEIYRLLIATYLLPTDEERYTEKKMPGDLMSSCKEERRKRNNTKPKVEGERIR